MATKPSMSINLGLGAAPDVETPELYSALMPLYNAIKNTMYAVDSYTGNSQIDPSEYSQVNNTSGLLTQKTAVFFVELTEAVTAGTTINFHNSAGIAAQKAELSYRPAHAFALVSGNIGDTIPVCLLGLCTGIGGLTPGTQYYQSATQGLITATVTAQKLGVALGESLLWFNPN